jgi:hypothetical protein
MLKSWINVSDKEISGKVEAVRVGMVAVAMIAKKNILVYIDQVVQDGFIIKPVKLKGTFDQSRLYTGDLRNYVSAEFYLKNKG